VTRSARPVMIAAGGTGGHVFPALAVADVLRERGVPVVWVGTKRGLEAKVVPAAGIPMRWIAVAGLRGKGLIGRIVGPIRLLAAVLQSLVIVLRVRPRAVLGMGGFVTGPVGVAAKLTGRTLVLHEQNAVAGFTNRLLARFAATVFTAMPDAFSDSIKTVIVGNPLRQEIESLANNEEQMPSQTNSKNDHELCVLVVGGSQGAQVLNKLLPDVVKRFNFSVKVVHQTGLSMYESVQDGYASPTQKTHEVSVHKFIDNIVEKYSWADIVVCRSGAMTVSELAAMSLPSVLVPFPHAVDDHQTKNAQFLADAGAAVLIPQAELTVDRLVSVLSTFNDDRESLNRMGEAARSCHRPAAAEKVADALLGSMGKAISADHEVRA